jgi:hypothetical protein
MQPSTSPTQELQQVSFSPTIIPPKPSQDMPFIDRRQLSVGAQGTGDRRQFGNSYHNLTPEGKQLAEAIDAYKVECRRRYITTDELLRVLSDLGYKQG